MTSICTKRYVIKALIVVTSPTISIGKIPETTAQNIPTNENKFYFRNRIKIYKLTTDDCRNPRSFRRTMNSSKNWW
jgi:hypothetical protein